jgi:hypothetical protein
MNGIPQKTGFVSGCAGRCHWLYSLLHRRIFQRPIILATEYNKTAITIMEFVQILNLSKEFYERERVTTPAVMKANSYFENTIA